MKIVKAIKALLGEKGAEDTSAANTETPITKSLRLDQLAKKGRTCRGNKKTLYLSSEES